MLQLWCVCVEGRGGGWLSRCHLRGRREAVRREGEPAEPQGHLSGGCVLGDSLPFCSEGHI